MSIQLRNNQYNLNEIVIRKKIKKKIDAFHNYKYNQRFILNLNARTRSKNNIKKRVFLELIKRVRSVYLSLLRIKYFPFGENMDRFWNTVLTTKKSLISEIKECSQFYLFNDKEYRYLRLVIDCLNKFN